MGQKYIYLFLSDTGTVLSGLVKHFSKEKYIHASISYEPNLYTMYSFGRKHPSNPIFAGFVMESAYSGFFGIKKHVDCTVYRIPVTEEQLQMVKSNIGNFIKNIKGFRYNLIGLIGVKVGMPLKRTNKHYFCTEFVAEVLGESGIMSKSKPYGLISAKDFTEINGAEMIFEGKLSQYVKTLETQEPVITREKVLAE